LFKKLAEKFFAFREGNMFVGLAVRLIKELSDFTSKNYHGLADILDPNYNGNGISSDDENKFYQELRFGLQIYSSKNLLSLEHEVLFIHLGMLPPFVRQKNLMQRCWKNGQNPFLVYQRYDEPAVEGEFTLKHIDVVFGTNGMTLVVNPSWLKSVKVVAKEHN
jgi:hypothetical protein